MTLKYTKMDILKALNTNANIVLDDVIKNKEEYRDILNEKCHTPIYSLYREMIVQNNMEVFKSLLPVLDFNHHYLVGETVISYCVESYENDFLNEMYHYLHKNNVPYKDWHGGNKNDKDFLLNRIIQVGDYVSYVFLWLMDNSVDVNIGSAMETLSKDMMSDSKLQLMVYEVQKYGVENKDIRSDFVRFINSFEGPLDITAYPQMRIVKVSDWANVFAKVESERLAELAIKSSIKDKKLKV